MWALFIYTLITSATDSLNPIAITQQFVLQSMVKKRSHILFFIIPTGLTNMIGGFLVYYGLGALISNFWGGFISKFIIQILAAELILGIVFLVATGWLLQNRRTSALKAQLKTLTNPDSVDSDEADAARKIKSVSPAALIILGVSATIAELVTALPYFAFLAVLLNYKLSFLQLSFFLGIYNLIYTLPLIILYIVYIKAQDKFDSLYKIIKSIISKCAHILAPLVVGIIGVVLVFHSVVTLMS